MEKFLKSNGFKFNTRSDAWDNGNTRVYFEDNDVIIIRFNNPTSQCIEWKNRINGNMPVDAQEKIVSMMVKA